MRDLVQREFEVLVQLYLDLIHFKKESEAEDAAVQCELPEILNLKVSSLSTDH